jgi:Domain of unknown function (DUF4129)
MSDSRSQPSLADYVAIAISPALIIAMVVSLVYFLIEVLYAGHFAGRLQWVFFCFVIAAVLIARISMTGGIAERSGLYGIVLAGATFAALQSFVEYPPGPFDGWHWLVNIGLMSIVWWSTHQLTWDCTHIDETEDASGAGLLEAAGFSDDAGGGSHQQLPDTGQPQGRVRRRRQKQSGLLAWWERYEAYRRDKKKETHTLGTWVIYFSLAALPLFGLGQALIPAEELGRRRYAFWLLTGYVASGLGLLLTTTFLGLRRYLRQKRLKMPLSMTGVWLTMGAIMIGLLLVLGAFLPRPDAEYTIFSISKAEGPGDRAASRSAMLMDDAGKGEGRPGTEQSKSADAQQPVSSPNSREQGGAGNQKSDDGKSGGQSAGQSKDSSGKAKGEQGKPAGQAQASGKPITGSAANSRPIRGSSGTSRSGSNFFKHLVPPALEPLIEMLGRALKWFVFIILVIVARSGLRFLANFTEWARKLLDAIRNWWQQIWGSGRAARDSGEDKPLATARPVKQFAFYVNPFVTGAADSQSPEDLARYSFLALEAWAREQSFPRALEETPIEFGNRLTEHAPGMEQSARRLAAIYSQAVYSSSRLPGSSLDELRAFWNELDRHSHSEVGSAV